MTSTPPSDIPEYRGKTLTPVSPRPVHIPEPSNIPVLENQMDPVFNETSTHIDTSTTTKTLESNMDFESGQGGLLHQASLYPFTYAANDKPTEEAEGNGEQTDGDDNDDYAMSLDLDDDGNWESTVTPSNRLDANYSTTVQPPVTSDTTVLSTEIPASSTTVPYGALPPSTNTTTIEQPTEPTTSSQSVDKSARISTINEVEGIDVASLIADAANVRHRDNLNQPETGDDADLPNEGVNIQALLDNLSPPIATASSSQGDTPAAKDSPAVSIDVLKPGNELSSSSGGLTAHPNLPPRPPPQEKPTTHSGYSPQDDIRSYHPHNQTPLGSSGFPPQKQSNAFRPAQGPPPPPIISAGAPGTVIQPTSSLPPPPLATFQQPPPLTKVQQQQSPTATNLRQREKTDGNLPKGAGNGSVDENDEIPWGPEIQKAYDEFLHDERTYVSEGQWDRFPPNSRLFIGNLPTEKVTKQDLFYIFQKHGRLAQVSIKQAYGFIQFLDAEACHRALQAEQGSSVRGRKMHLEISKPQKNTRNAGGEQRSAVSRRSRSPDYTRGANSPRNQGFGGGRGDRIDRGVDNRSGKSGRDRPYRGRDDYRPARSPSPRGHRGGDDYRRGRDRSRDRFDRRSRSRSPYRRGNRYPSRSPPPRWGAEEEADMLLPKRQPRDVPEVQFLLLDELDRNFINYVEKVFRDRGLRTDVLFLDPRLSLAVVVRRHIVEGVHAIVKLTRQSQMNSKIPLQVFDRSAGTDTVRFDEYENLEPYIAAELVVRARPLNVVNTSLNQINAVTSPQSYQAPTYGQMFAPPPTVLPPQQPQQPAIGGGLAGLNPVGVPPNLTNLITSLDGPALQKLLGALQQQQPGGAGPPMTPQHLPQPQHQQQQAQPAAPHPALPADLASLLGASAASVNARPAHQPLAYPQPQTNSYAALATNPAFAANPALASLLASTAVGGVNRPAIGGIGQPVAGITHPAGSTTAGQQPTPHVANIMEQLAKWKQ